MPYSMVFGPANNARPMAPSAHTWNAAFLSHFLTLCRNDMGVLPSTCACRSPEKPGTMLIKRLLALEGDWVTIPGRIEVEKIPKVFRRHASIDGVTKCGPVVLPIQAMIAVQGHCWVEGDNPDMSTDSKSRFGPVMLIACLAAVLCKTCSP